MSKFDLLTEDEQKGWNLRAKNFRRYSNRGKHPLKPSCSIRGEELYSLVQKHDWKCAYCSCKLSVGLNYWWQPNIRPRRRS